MANNGQRRQGTSPLLTYKDMVDHLVDWMGSNALAEAQRDARRAVLTALRKVTNEHNWSYYYNRGRITTNEVYQTGTVDFDYTGGTYERQLTLASGTWPEWAHLGVVQINNITYEVEQRKSSTIITLTESSNPGADIAAGTAYTIYRDTYSLPDDFAAMGSLFIVNHMILLDYQHPSVWLERQRIYRGSGTPRLYTIRGNPDYYNSMALSFYPPPDQAFEIDYIYKRRPGNLRTENYGDGTVTITSGSVTITGTGTAFNDRHVGSVIRVTDSKKLSPTAPWGNNPAVYEGVIATVVSETSITVDVAPTESLSLVKYNVSDLVDIESGTMQTVFMRCSELQTAHARNRKDLAMMEQSYRQELLLAREADSRTFSDRSAGQVIAGVSRLRDFPIGSDMM